MPPLTIDIVDQAPPPTADVAHPVPPPEGEATTDVKLEAFEETQLICHYCLFFHTILLNISERER